MLNLQGQLQTSLAESYQVVRELGRGGMATVFLVHDLKHGRQIALKVLHPHYGEALGGERFTREIQIAARLAHPHIVPVFDSGRAGDLLYYTMPYVAGESLRSRLARDGRVPLGEAIQIACEVADALAYAHAAGVVHRDVKPENILLAGSHAIVADFGVARALQEAASDRLTQTGMTLGTPAYMSPEQLRGEDGCDGRSDIYSLASVLYEMLAGEPPYAAPTLEAVLTKRLTEPAPPLRVRCEAASPALERTVLRALARTPAERFQTVLEFKDALRAAAGTGSVRSRATAACDEPPPSLAVLPFVNRSPDPDNEYFSDGLSEELINALARIPELRVASRTSSFAFKGRSEDVRRIGEQLGVRTVLEGSVRRAGNKLRISAELVSAEDGYTLWSDIYAREMEDVFAVQDDIARAITETLKVKLVGRPREAPLVVRATDSIEAYHLYLKGRFFWNRRTAEGMLQAIRFFEEAIAIDGAYAEAHAGLALAHVLAGHFEHGVSRPADAMPKGKAAARRALELDPSNAEAYCALGFARYCYDFDWAGAERDLLRAVELEPKSPTGHHWLGMLYVTTGRHAEAVARLQHAQQLDPLSLPTVWGAAWVHHYIGDYEAAAGHCRKVMEMDPYFIKAPLQLGATLSALGRHEEAVATLQHAANTAVRNPRSLFPLAYALGAMGRATEAGAVLRELHEQAGEEYVFPDYIASAHAGVGEAAAALEWLERAYEERSSRMIVLGVDPMFASLRGDVRFTHLAQQLRVQL